MFSIALGTCLYFIARSWNGRDNAHEKILQLAEQAARVGKAGAETIFSNGGHLDLDVLRHRAVGWRWSVDVPEEQNQLRVIKDTRVTGHAIVGQGQQKSDQRILVVLREPAVAAAGVG